MSGPLGVRGVVVPKGQEMRGELSSNAPAIDSPRSIVFDDHSIAAAK